MLKPLFALSAVLTACAPDEAEVKPPELTFLAPTEGSTVAAGDVAVSMVVEHFTLVEPETARATPSSSPWPLRAFIAEARAHNEEGVPAGYVHLVVDDTIEQSLTSTQATVAGVTTGPHTLRAELFYADGDPLEPPVIRTVSFTAE